MGLSRLVPLGALLATAALAQKPAAVQLCLTLPEGVSLFSPTSRANYRLLAPGTYLLDLDLTVDGVAPERLTPSGPRCLRAWVPPHHVLSVGVAFDRTSLNLTRQEHRVDLKLKPDLWYDGGEVTVPRAPWARVSMSVPGKLTLDRLRGPQPIPVTDFERVPAGSYRVRYEAPPAPTHACRTTVEAVGVGTIRQDNKPELFAELVERYRAELLPSVLAGLKIDCSDAQALTVRIRLADGAYVDPIHPVITRVELPGRAPRYVWRVDASVIPFESGQVLEVAPGQRLSFEAVAAPAGASNQGDGPPRPSAPPPDPALPGA